MVKTEPYGSAGLPVRTLRIDVVGGPDTGRSLVAASDLVTIGSAPSNDLVLGCPTVSRFHLELEQSADGVRLRDCGSTNGTAVGAVRVERAFVPAGTVVRLGASSIRVEDGEAIQVALHAGDRLEGLRGQTPVMRRLMAQVDKAARADASVLLCGESGTGKELIARALHQHGPRAGAPFVTVDCASLTPTLVASELFGHERGAFTGAEQRRTGAIEQADGGTLFLDEIGELPTALQTTLLGVLERRRFRRLGGTEDIDVDVRLVSATNRDLRAEVNRGSFRLDLYFRIAVVALAVPPLRARADDLPLLIEHFVRECGHEGPIDELISPAVMRSLMSHHWPGNVRELRNLIEATLAMGEPPPLEPPFDIAGDDALGPLLGLPYKEARAALLARFEARYLRTLLDRTGGNVSGAARAARMDRSHLIDLIRRHNLKA